MIGSKKKSHLRYERHGASTDAKSDNSHSGSSGTMTTVFDIAWTLFKSLLKVISNLYFAIFLLILIALSSSIGSFLEQDESIEFYQENYSISKPIYGFISWPWITFLGLDHVYKTWWFFGLLFLLGSSLVICTMTRQFPLFLNSKEVFFKKEKKSYLALPFFRKVKNISYIRENLLLKIQTMNFCIYQKGNFLYGYKGLVGRISPILVHFSLLLILFGSSVGAVKNFKAQEILPKGEIFHIQNPISAGWLTDLPDFNLRVNDFWVEYQNKKIHQFYSNLSILDNYGNELKEQTISVNNPLRYKQIDFYQSDWNLVGIRLKQIGNKQLYEIPLFSFQKDSKSWITWIQLSPKQVSSLQSLKKQDKKDFVDLENTLPNSFSTKKDSEKTYSIIFDHFQNTFRLYDSQGNFLGIKNVGELIDNEFSIMDVIPSTGLLVKYDPSIPIIYFGFGLLMITSSLSFFPYTQLWVFHQSENSWLGGSTNRGKIQLEIEFENLVRLTENLIVKSDFIL